MTNANERGRQQVLTLCEASQFLRVSERTLWSRVKAGEVPFFKVGKQYRFLVSELESWATTEPSKSLVETE